MLWKDFRFVLGSNNGLGECRLAATSYWTATRFYELLGWHEVSESKKVSYEFIVYCYIPDNWYSDTHTLKQFTLNKTDRISPICDYIVS